MKVSKPSKSDKKIVKKQSWTIELISYSDGTSNMNRTNDGFSALEMLGICTRCIYEINDQTKGVISPTIINRKVIKRK